MKIIFIDVDGVVATSFARVMPDHYYDFNHKCLNRLERILEAEPESRIVISSCWRHGRDVDELQAVFIMRGFKYPKRIIDKTITLPYIPKEETGGICIPRLRGLEIYQWLEKHEELTGEKIKHYVIFDDDGNMLWWQRNNFIKTSTYKGIQESHVKKALKILNTGV